MSLKRVFTVFASVLVFFASVPSLADTIVVTVTGGKSPNPISFPATGFKFSVTTASNVGGGAGAGKVQVSPIGIVKHFDSASPSLFQAAFTGIRFSSVELQFFHQHDVKTNAQPYYKIILSDAIITSLKQGDFKDGQPMEVVSFIYGKIQEQEASSGSAGGSTASDEWDLTTMTAK